MTGLPAHRVLFDEAAILRRVGQLASEIAPAVPEGLPFVLLCVLRGGMVFSADLARALARAGRVPRLELLGASLYRADGQPEARATLHGAVPDGLAGAAVLVVDDILDTGRTLGAVLHAVRRERPAWLRTCVLLEKPGLREPPLVADHAGFAAPPGWVFGYGLDSDGDHRSLPFLAVRESETPRPAET
jgi:hypoxanthine phosphoribosyltransferase